MASAAEQLAGLGTLSNAINGLFGGGGSKTTQTNSGSTTTSGQDITAEGLQRIINQMLSGTGGVKDISGAARGAGLYNSSTEAQMLNDLQTRIAGEAAKQSAKTVTTTSPNTVEQTTVPAGGMSPMMRLGAIGGMNLIGNALDRLIGSSGATGAVTTAGLAPSLGTSFGGNGLTSAGDLSSTASNLTLGGNSTAGLLSGLQGVDLGSGISGFTGAGTTLGSGLADSLGASFGANGLTSAGDLAGAGLSFASPISSLIGGLTGQDVFSNPLSFGLSGLGSGLALTPAIGPLGLAVGPALSAVGGLFKNMSVICTALQAKGLLDKEEYAKGQDYLQTISSWTLKGYYLWGQPTAKLIEANSPWAIALSLPFAVSRTHLIASKSKWRFFKYPLGTLTRFIGQPICWILGGLITLGENTYGRFI